MKWVLLVFPRYRWKNQGKEMLIFPRFFSSEVDLKSATLASKSVVWTTKVRPAFTNSYSLFPELGSSQLNTNILGSGRLSPSPSEFCSPYILCAASTSVGLAILSVLLFYPKLSVSETPQIVDVTYNQPLSVSLSAPFRWMNLFPACGSFYSLHLSCCE